MDSVFIFVFYYCVWCIGYIIKCVGVECMKMPAMIYARIFVCNTNTYYNIKKAMLIVMISYAYFVLYIDLRGLIFMYLLASLL